ncbi:MAG: hypothetical protein JXA33_29100 [Anaerolineae bacterium]|nr:hypothetical protein [Anaerolineae bacterium]
MEFRTYDANKDKKATHRIWREVGWIGDNEKHKEALDMFALAGKGWVAELRGEAECLVLTMPGMIRHLTTDLSFCAVTSVSTSYVARKQGLAQSLTARAVAIEANDGAVVAGLGVFEQGFYNALGFGNGSYEHWIAFDPATLKLKNQARVPYRLTLEDWDAMHKSRLARLRGHGACILLPGEATRCEMMWMDNPFGMGYYDGPNGELTHHFWGVARGEHGPNSLWWFVYQTPEQLLELLAVLKNLSDQVNLIQMHEPPEIQFQDLLNQPFKYQRISETGKYESKVFASAYCQMRICNLAEALAHTHLRGGTVRFNLKLHDPIEHYLDTNAPWRGLSGEYVVTLGSESGVESGRDSTLPTLTASVGAFTRMWMGVLPATSLAITDILSGPYALLEELDWLLRFPTPRWGWDF